MRKFLPVALAALAILFLGTSAVLYQKYQQASNNYTEMQAQEQTTRNRYGQAINEIASIQDSLNTIALGTDGAKMISSDLDMERRLSETGGDRALARIGVLKAGIERTKARIEQLDENLKKSGAKISGLQKMMAGLRRDVKEKEEMVAQLTSKVDGLQTQVSGLQGEVETQAQNIEDKRRELGTIYYVAGSKHDLEHSGVIVAKGGVVGLGKTLKPSGQINEGMFTALDTDQETIIHIAAPKAQIVSAQPAASYALEPSGKELDLRILDPKEFRKIKHLIIVTA